jgi:hypothetical protein
MSTADIIRQVADPLIAAGLDHEQVRAEVLARTGLGIGGGGGAGSSFGDRDNRACPYCGATGGGGHGGLCPNGGQ